MKVNKLSKHKNTKKNTKRNNKTKKRINKTKKCINRLKGGDDNENKEKLINFINSLPKIKDEKKLLTYFDIKIILLYIVAYNLLDKNNLQQIFIWFSTNTENSYPFIMTLLTTDKINEKNRLLTLIYEKINLAISSELKINFEFNNHLQYNETFNEHKKFIEYLNSNNYEQYTQTQINRTKNIRKQLQQSLKKIPVMPKVDNLTTLLGENNYLHFMANYLQFFDEKGHLRAKTDIIYNLKSNTPTSKILKNSKNITVKECSNLINSQIPFKQIINNNSPATLPLSNNLQITNTNKKLSNTNTITPYSCFVKNTKLLINKSNISSSNA
jgi:hypothetical protein